LVKGKEWKYRGDGHYCNNGFSVTAHDGLN
jgi:hypothetical protein